MYGGGGGGGRDRVTGLLFMNGLFQNKEKGSMSQVRLIIMDNIRI